ncbi:MAG TPA: bifunctional hydroxymethylpyrimidine kinase/phosphomethylpyrimidine kinase [Steroidobacteraceae bacterium]
MTAVLVIAGADSSGGAGLARDVRTLAGFGTRVVCAVTAVTAQSDSRVTAVHPVPPHIVRAQIAAAFATTRVGAIKIGMLGTRAIALAVAASIPPREQVPIVLDPVLVSSSGGALLDAGGREALRENLVPRATLVTPNIAEAAALLGTEPASTEEELLRQARALLALGAAAVLIKGGHGSGSEAVDLLLSGAQPLRRLTAPRTAKTQRGTGCALASGIAAGLAAGLDLADACARAKHHVLELLQRGQ